jgi:hypothetical protein
LFDNGIPFFAFDPIGRWRFLRYPGKGPHARGFPVVVVGGAAPDLPLTPDNAPQLIRAAMQSGVSMVIDLYSKDLSKADWRKIVRASIETILYEGEGHGLRHVFLEEAAEFVPQRVYDGQTYAAVEKLARMGGNVGVGLTLINQRAEEVNKAVLELCDNLLLHRQRGKNSIRSLGKWLDVANVKPPKKITDSLANLPTGRCWAWFKDAGRPRLITIAGKRSFDPNRREMTKSSLAGGGVTPVTVTDFVARMKDALAGKAVKPVKPAAVVQPKEVEVNETEAQALRDENAQLKNEVARLRRMVESAAPAVAPTHEVVGAVDIDAVINELKRRAAKDPEVIALVARRPEIVVTEERSVIRMDATTQPGFLAGMIARGFFDSPVANATVKAELKRRGRSVHDANLSRDLNKLSELGFLFRERDGWCAAPDMKVNIESAP